jgi:methionine-rich copper-binding protein CopC
MVRALKGAVIAVAAFTVALLFVQLASAHSRPIRFDPAPGAVLTAAPAQVTGWFTSDLRRDPNWNFLHVTGPTGQRVDTGEPILSADRLSMTVNLQAGLGPGRYLVTWRTWDDADGEIFGDCFTFFVGQEAANAAVTEKYRLDGGSQCERIEFDARAGTPVPGQTPMPEGEEHDDGEASSDGDDDGGLPGWALVLGIGGGLAVGLVGGRLIGTRA